MNSETLIIILLLLLIFLLLLVISGLVIFYVIKNKGKNEEAPSVAQQVNQLGVDDFKKIFQESKKESEPILGLCSICEKELIKSDHYEIDKLHFCKDHFSLYTENSWKQITNQLTTADTPEAGVYIYNFKQKLWRDNLEPMYIQCEYKIDVTNDHIETYVQLHVLEDRAEHLKKIIEEEKIL